MNRSRGALSLLGIAAIGASLLLFTMALWMGALNQDEGWYLYAGRLVAEGSHPFIDFASTQGPVMAYAYALAQPLVRLWGVAGGRVFTALLGMGSLLGTAWLAARLARDGGGAREAVLPASLAAFLLLGLNLYHVYYVTVVKTYALTSCWLVFAFVSLTVATGPGGRGRRLAAAALAGGLVALATATRISAGAVVPATVVVLAIAAWRRRVDRLLAAAFLSAAAVTLAAVLLPFLWHAPESLRFGLVAFHAARDAGGLLNQLAYKGGFVSRLTGFYFLPLLVAVVLLAHRLMTPREEGAERLPVVAVAALWSAAALTGLHLAAPFPYDDYQVIAMPLLVVGLVRLWQAAGPRLPLARASLVLLLILSLAHSFSSPLLHGWVVGERDRIWWPMRTSFPLARLRLAARQVEGLVAASGEAGDLLLTQDTYLAVETGLRVPAGLELGPFSCFPELSDAQAARIGVLTPDRLAELIRTTPAPVAAFSGYGFAIAAPRIVELPVDVQQRLWAILLQHYNEVERLEAFGQADTTLRLFVRGL